MKYLKPFLIGFSLVLALDGFWWLIAYSMPPLGIQVSDRLSKPWLILLTLDPTVVLPWVAIGLFIALAGWTRRSSAKSRLWVALGSLAGTAAALAIHFYFLFFVGCGCEPSGR